MIVIGAGGHAKEVLEILHVDKRIGNVHFFDEITAAKTCLGSFPVISSDEEVIELLKKDTAFISAISGTAEKEKLVNRFKKLGGVYQSVISSTAVIGHFEVCLENGLNVMQNVFISNYVQIGEGSLLNYGSSIHHDCRIGRYSEISPKAQLLGGVTVGDYVFIGAGAIILPKVNIGSRSIIAAGAVVTVDVPEDVLVGGIPGKIIKKLKKL